MSRERRGSPSGARGRSWLALVVAAGALLAAGCAHAPPPVQPWQREHLSTRGMRLDLPDEAAEDRFRQHWLGSREGSDLGFGQPGGGCGCN